LQLNSNLHRADTPSSAHEAWADIATIATVYTPKSTSRAAFLQECASGAFDGCAVAYRTFDSFDITGRVDTELVSALPSSLRFICHNGAGYDQIDTYACRVRGIKVSNTPTAVDDATADIGMFLMLGALRGVNVAMTSLREGKWRGDPLPALGHDPEGKVLGILGMGGIGKNMARKARAFGMRIRYHNRTRLDAAKEKEVEAEYVDFDTLLKESDVLSLNLPLNVSLSASLHVVVCTADLYASIQPKTRHTISGPQFAQMKRGMVIVNTARGAVMDEAALVDALKEGQVGSVGLDVYEEEPKIHPGLVSNPRVLLVPHLGTWTVETQTKMEEWTISNVKMAVQEGRLRSIIPEMKDLQ
jgi:glyoxylate reductase